MSISKDKTSLENHTKNALKAINIYLDNLIQSDDSRLQSVADKLCYWFEDYINFLGREQSFDPTKYPKYKKGQIIKVHLGFNIGSEEGGLHYAMVIENNNSIKSPVLNVVPLTSVKKTTDISKIRSDRGDIFLGNELHRLLSSKIATQKTSLINEVTTLNEFINTSKDDYEKIDIAEKRLKHCEDLLKSFQNATKEISKMKLGSIALVGQITTVSKIRIFDPKNSNGVLSNIRMSNETMDKIDATICQLFTKQR